MATTGQSSAKAAAGAKTEAVHVAVRVRPLSAHETAQGSAACVGVVDRSVLLVEKQFDFDAALPPATEQESVYSELVAPMIEQFFEGFNATVFAYGQTGSGKTYTMGNKFASSEVPVERGIIPRVMDDIFSKVQDSTNRKNIEIRLSYLEILNEEIHDLLAVSSSGLSTPSSGLSVRGDGERGIVISGLSEHVVKSADYAGNLLRSGALVRATASTSMNAQSSRSHAICTIIMEQREMSVTGGGMETRYAKFHLVDLAGSERVRRTNSQGARFKEGVNINRGLLALGNVINALCERSRASTQPSHVPYRDSKLTRLLQDSLGGNSKTLMIACVSPADVNYEETSNTLRYASRALHIENQAVINKERDAESEVTFLKQQLEIVQLQLLQQSQGMPNSPVRIESQSSSRGKILGCTVDALQEENRKLREALLLSNSVKDKWEKIATDLTKKNNTESRVVTSSQPKVNQPSMSTPIKTGQLSRLELLRKFQNGKVKLKEGGVIKRKADEIVTPNKHRRTHSTDSQTPGTAPLIEKRNSSAMEGKEVYIALLRCRSELDAAKKKIVEQRKVHSKGLNALKKKLDDALNEVHTLREQITAKKKPQKRKARESYEALETLFSSSDDEDDDSGADSDYIDDEDRRRRGAKTKKGNRTPSSKSSTAQNGDVIDEIDDLLETSAATCCSCHSKCATKACACKSQNRLCGSDCSCNPEKCRNVSESDERTCEAIGSVTTPPRETHPVASAVETPPPSLHKVAVPETIDLMSQ